MSEAKGARLYKRGKRFYIRDSDGRFFSTGTGDREEAEGALAAYIATKGGPGSGPRDPAQMTAAEALESYLTAKVDEVADPARIADCVVALVPLLGSLTLDKITGEVCRFYERERKRAPGTIRKELGTLRAAVRWNHREGYLTSAPAVSLPAKPEPRDRWLTRDEVAALLRACRRNPKARHLCRYILVSVYSGTRSTAVLRMGFMPSTVGGHVDTARGIMYRRAAGVAETKKRTPTVPVPARLLAHLRRWERMGARWVVEVDGERVGSVKRSWATAVRESGIEHATKHDLRHTACTWLMQAGVDRWSAAGFLGMSVELLESTYGHHCPDHLRPAVEAMGRRA